MNELTLVNNQSIQDKIYTIRGVQVMIDKDLALLYGVETRVLNQAVKRNIERFPEEFMFQLTKEELENWMSQIVISNKEIMGLRKLPFVFSEQGVSMLSAVLKSQTVDSDGVTGASITNVSYDACQEWYYGPYEQAEEADILALYLQSTREKRA